MNVDELTEEQVRAGLKAVLIRHRRTPDPEVGDDICWSGCGQWPCPTRRAVRKAVSDVSN